jgi:ACS family glucarate transporter-like MFS transporter
MTEKPTNVRWRVFILIASASFVAYVMRTTMSIGAPTMIEDLGITKVQFGWITSAFLWSYAALQFPGGVFGDKTGPRKALTIIAMLWGVGLAMTAIVPGQAVLSAGAIVGLMIAVRFLNGIVHAPVFPVINVSISKWFPAGALGLPVGLSSSGLTLGSAVASPLLAWMIVEFGWRWSFLALAPLGFILSGLWWWYSRDNPAEHKATNQAEVELITGEHPPPALAPINPPGWVRVLRDRNVLLLTGSYACSNFVFYSVMSYFFLYLVEARMFDEIKAGALNGQIWLLAAGGAAFGGWLCDRLCKQFGLRWGYRWPIIIGQGGCAILFLIGAYYANPLLAVAILSFAFAFQQMTEGAYWAASISIGHQFAGAAGGILNTGGNVMGAINAVALVWLAESHGWTVAMASNAVFTLLALLLMLLVRGDEPVPLD